MQKLAPPLCLILFLIATVSTKIFSQCSAGYNAIGAPCGGTVQTAVPFLRIAPDARSAAMGDAGIALSADADAVHFNASNLAFADAEMGVSANYTPWFREVNNSDASLAYIAGFYRFGKEAEAKQAIGFGIKQFSTGNVEWTNSPGVPISRGNPNETEASLSYARQLNQQIAIGLTAKYVYSNLAGGLNISGLNIHSGRAISGDVSITYKKPVHVGFGQSDLTVAVAVSNIGSKANYLYTSESLPTNLGVGAAWRIISNPSNSLAFTIELNKLLVPTPDTTGKWRTLSPVAGIFDSFVAAPGGVREKLQEINISGGVEYWYCHCVALRAGYFYEDPNKGGRQYLTAGFGLKYRIVGLNFSYLWNKSDFNSPLDHTVRFSAVFDVPAFKGKV